MIRLSWLIMFLSLKMYGQKVTRIETKTIIQTANKFGPDSAFSKLMLREGYFYFNLIDPNLTVSLCSKIENIDKSNFGNRYLIQSASCLKDTVINNQLIRLLKKYRESFSFDITYLEYPNYELFKAVAIQNFKSSIPKLIEEYDFWNLSKNRLNDTSSRKYKIAVFTSKLFFETIKYISEFESGANLKNNYFHIKESILKGRETISEWDTIKLQNKIEHIKQIEFRKEPFFIKHFENADFLNSNSQIEVCIYQTKAIVSLYNFPWRAIYQMELLDNNNLAIRFITGGIE